MSGLSMSIRQPPPLGIASAEMTKKRHLIDWEAVEREFRAGQLTIREIARQHSITDTAVRKHAKEAGWERDLTDQVRRAIKNETVRTQVRSELSREPVNDAEIVAAHASRGARAIEGHLARCDRLKALSDKLMTELETYMSGGKPTVEIFVSRADSPATIIRTLSDTAERIAKIERQALNIDSAPEESAVLVIETSTPARRKAALGLLLAKQEDP